MALSKKELTEYEKNSKIIEKKQLQLFLKVKILQKWFQFRNYRDLIVWQKSMKLITDIYKISKLFPKEELFGLTSQIRRAAISIPSNIAEGYGRNSTGDYKRFLTISVGSLYEFQSQLEISYNL